MIRVFESRHPAGGVIEPHRHQDAYAAIVLEGAYEESSVDGTWLCEPGDVVVHPRWHLHTDRFAARRTRVLNVLAPLPVAPGVWRTRRMPSFAGPESLIRELGRAEPIAPRPAPRSLARFTEHVAFGIARAAGRAGISREHASRTYRRHFGLPPRAARAETQLRLAIALLTTTALPLSQVALQAGFADQAHFTRRLRAATGRTPREIRRDG